jgi:hypothetical protein
MLFCIDGCTIFYCWEIFHGNQFPRWALETKLEIHSSTTFREVWRGEAPPAAPQAYPSPQTRQISGAECSGKSGHSTILVKFFAQQLHFKEKYAIMSYGNIAQRLQCRCEGIF